MPEDKEAYPNQPELAGAKRDLRERSVELSVDAHRVDAHSGKGLLTLAEDIYEYLTKDVI